MTLRGIDVSQYQGTIDWPKVKAAGIDFAIARCVRETGAIDDTFAPNVAGARALGILAGAYCFLNEGAGDAQGRAFVTAVKAAGGPRGMLLVVDVERGAGSVPSVPDIRAFVARVRAAIPATHPVIVYGSPGVLDPLNGTLVEFGPWWMALYGTPQPTGSWASVYAARGGDAAASWARKAAGWPSPTIWQFASSATVGGVTGRVDVNAYRGTRAELEALAGLVVDQDALERARQAGIREGRVLEHNRQSAGAKVALLPLEG